MIAEVQSQFPLTASSTLVSVILSHAVCAQWRINTAKGFTCMERAQVWVPAAFSGPVRVPTGAALAALRMEYWRCIAGTHRSCVWRIVIKVIRGHSPYDPHSFLPALLQEG